MMCPSCGQDDSTVVTTSCRDEDDGEQLTFLVCKNCDYGINEHTEGECNCA